MGKKLYEKIIDFGVLPNATTKRVSHNISNLYMIVSASGMTRYSQSSNLFYTLPFISTAGIANCISLFVEPLNVTIETGMDRRNCAETYIILRYTKTTD